MDAKQLITNALRSYEPFLSAEEPRELLLPKIEQAADAYAPELLQLLHNEPTLRTHFFDDTILRGTTLFRKDKFLQFLRMKDFLPGNYTSYKNTQPLLQSQWDDVVLSWPYKDCVVNADMHIEDKKKKQNELMINEILAPDEVP